MRPGPPAGWFRRDAVTALLLAAGSAVSAALYTRIGVVDEPAPLWLIVVAIVGHTVPLAWRRRYPLAVAIIISVAFFVNGQFAVPEYLFSNIELFLAIYSLGAWGRDRRIATVARVIIVIGMFLWIAVNLAVTVSNPDLMPNYSRSGVFSQFASFALINVITNALYFGAAYYFGNAAWRAAQKRAELVSRTAELTAERERTAAQAVALDRVRIARELHDVVAHHVSVMGVQAGAARRVLETNPALASESLATIEQSARSAVDELHRLLTTLRETDTESAVLSSSTRGLDQLPELVAESDATLQIVGTERPVTALTGFTIYRVAQEALTNVRKHAGDRAVADVRLRYLTGIIELEVTDDGSVTTLAPSTGLGLVGMRERVTAVGGTLEVGPRSRGGYLVRATVPA
jgi:signal transduction histidine kinase